MPLWATLGEGPGGILSNSMSLPAVMPGMPTEPDHAGADCPAVAEEAGGVEPGADVDAVGVDAVTETGPGEAGVGGGGGGGGGVRVPGPPARPRGEGVGATG